MSRIEDVDRANAKAKFVNSLQSNPSAAYAAVTALEVTGERN